MAFSDLCGVPENIGGNKANVAKSTYSILQNFILCIYPYLFMFLQHLHLKPQFQKCNIFSVCFLFMFKLRALNIYFGHTEFVHNLQTTLCT